ncbi:MAG: ATP synthase F1 subunit gamma [Chloroflexi bacterium]|nr:ATP synthase F1 subunit gamma [Chloroflexota bacterium]
MSTLREIRRRIRSIKNISQVTRAMQMVAAAKMRRAQEQVLGTRPYAEKAWEMLVHLAGQSTPGQPGHPLLQSRSVETVGFLLITADKGLCGAYNQNMIRMAFDYVERSSVPVKLVVVGRKGRDYMRRAGLDIVAEFVDLPSQPGINDITPISRLLLDDFLGGAVDQVVLGYTHFVNTLSQYPTIQPLLPVRYAAENGPHQAGEAAPASAVEGGVEYIYEPDPHTILDTVVPRFTEIQIYQAMLEAVASEHSARMVAMRNATENADSLMESLTLSYHQARQAAITREMLDIASGAEALQSA